MNKTPRLSKSGIEYLDYVWNFYSGCLNKKLGICPVPNCWAEGITKRMKHNYPNGFEPTLYPESFLSPLYLKKPSIIGCAFMGDLFGDWIDPSMMINVPMVPGLSQAEPLKEQIYRTINQCSQHTFLFKTKCPQNLPQWSPFPDNCRVGVTATNREAYDQALLYFKNIYGMPVRYLSLEPLLESVNPSPLDYFYTVDWVIIGAQTKPYKPPKIEWVQEIVEACDKAGIPVFLKENLHWPKWSADGALPFYKRCPSGTMELRQEMPKEH